MSLRQKYLKILSGLAPAGTAGVLMLLGAAASAVASQDPAAAEPRAMPERGVAERLSAIRDAASALAREQAPAREEGVGALRLAWGNWWRNWGWGGRPWWGWGWPNWGWPNWNNWHNWNNWPNWWRNW